MDLVQRCAAALLAVGAMTAAAVAQDRDDPRFPDLIPRETPAIGSQDTDSRRIEGLSRAPLARRMTPHWGHPFKGEDLRDGERIYWGREIHSDAGVQQFGYDLGAMRWDIEAERWRERSGDGSDNEDWYIYGQPVYAMRDGTVIACWRNAPENPQTGIGEGSFHTELTKYSGNQSRIYGGGNGFWIEHADGTRTEYAHFQPGTVPASLCPHNDALLPSVISSPDVRAAWPHIRVPEAERATVRRGQFLGLVGNAGTSSAPHLHIHREEGGRADTVKSGGTPVEITFDRGLAAPLSGTAPWRMMWQSEHGKPYLPGRSLLWPPRTVGPEHARHGYPAARYNMMFQHLADSGFQLKLVDFFRHNGGAYVNHVWMPSQGQWASRHGMTGAQFQTYFDQMASRQYAATFVESYASSGGPRYAAVFQRNLPGGWSVRHGITEQALVAEMGAAGSNGLSPVSLSVVSSGGQRRHTVLFRQQPVSGWVIKARIPAASYQAEYDRQRANGLYPRSISAYYHSGAPYYAVSFTNLPNTGRTDRHGMTSAQYQSAYTTALGAGRTTGAVSAFDGGSGSARYAASWWRD